MMAGLIHNPVLFTLKNNGYRLQYIHQIDYFVNELGILEFIYPEPTALSALRAFGNPTLSSIAGRKRRVSLETQTRILYDRIPAPDKPGPPWFTFAHVNLPAHAPPGGHWASLSSFEQIFRDRTIQANKLMLETVDQIKTKDPTAVIMIFGDHGAWRYQNIWGAGDPNENFRTAGVPTEMVTLDRAGIMIAIHSAGECNDYVYGGMTPVNMMRAVFACLAGDRKLLEGKAEDISLFQPHGRDLWLIAKDGLPLQHWKMFEIPR